MPQMTKKAPRERNIAVTSHSLTLNGFKTHSVAVNIILQALQQTSQKP